MATGSVQIRATGEAFAALARDLRRARSTTLRRELYSGMHRASLSAVEAVQRSALATMPKRGGAAERIAGAKYVVKQSGAQLGHRLRFRITGSADRKGRSANLYDVNKGNLRHPTYGHRPWKVTKVPAEWFDNAILSKQDEFVNALKDVVDAINKTIEGK